MLALMHALLQQFCQRRASPAVQFIKYGLCGVAAVLVNMAVFYLLAWRAFDRAISSITFNFGDAGGDDDGAVTIAAYGAAGDFLGSASHAYGAGAAQGGSLTLGFAGARYFIASTDGSIPNSVGWDIAGVRAAAAVPEPSAWALMIMGFGAVGVLTRGRTRKMRGA